MDSQQASYVQLQNNNQYIGNHGNNRQQQSTKYSSSDSRELASGANKIQQQHQQPRKPKLVRVSKEQPFISESDFTLNNNSNMVMEINNQTYDKHQPTMLQAQKVAQNKKYSSSNNGKAISKSRPSMEDLTYEPEQMHPHVYPQEQQQKQRVPSRHSKTSTQSKSSSLKQQQAIFNQHGDHNQMNSERIALSDEDEATSKTEIISFTKEDYILQKMLENTENSSSSSSSDRMVLNKKKEELRLKKLLAGSETRSNNSNSTYSLNSQNGNLNNNNNHQNHRNGNKNNMMPVARAYDGSEDSCPEDLDTISRFPAEEELFGSIHNGKEMTSKPILQQNRYTIHEGKERQFVEAAGGHMMAYPIKTKSKQHRQVIEPEAVIYENDTIFSEGSESMTEVDSVIEVVKSKKLANAGVGGATHGTNGNGKNQSKNEIKKELMKRLTDEVEHLKQHILKKHLKKVIKSEQRQEAANVVVESAKAYAIPVKTKKYNPNVMTVVHNSDNYIAEGMYFYTIKFWFMSIDKENCKTKCSKESLIFYLTDLKKHGKKVVKKVVPQRSVKNAKISLYISLLRQL